MKKKEILKIRGARHHNLKSIDVDIPKYNLVIISGLSGSGKSTLAFDTIYAEGQRRYVESLSAYARQFLEMMDKPDVDLIEGLSPAISIQQKTVNKNPRSTVGTITEIYDYMRLLFARIGIPHCTKCGLEISTQSIDTICDTVLKDFDATKILVMAPIIQRKKGTYEKLFKQIKKDGYSRIRIDGEIVLLDDDQQIAPLDKQKWHDIEIVIDRIEVQKSQRSRIFESIQTALKAAKGDVMIAHANDNNTGKNKNNDTNDRNKQIFSQNNACPNCGISIGELEPRVFSFNSPFGMCSTCNGLGMRREFDPALIIPDKKKSILDGAIAPWREGSLSYYMHNPLRAISKHLGFTLMTPIRKISKKDLEVLLYGTDKMLLIDHLPETIPKDKNNPEYKTQKYKGTFDGVIPIMDQLFKHAESDSKREWFEQFMRDIPCKSCAGKKLRPESLAVKVDKKSIMDVCDLSIDNCYKFFSTLNITKTQQYIAQDILKEIKERLEFLQNVGLNYLNLNRSSSTLSGGESQRIRLATQIGSNLTGVLYVLDEPTIGLHQRDNARLIKTLYKLRNLGNTVIVVEHDEEIIRSSDWIIDLGPKAGVHGGNIVFEGTLEQILAETKNKTSSENKSITGKYLRDNSLIKLGSKTRPPQANQFLTIKGATQNNLKNIDVKIPLGYFVAVTGVSGSGKSTLVNDILLKALCSNFYKTSVIPGKHKTITGTEYVDKVIAIDQSPIGRTPRSNPATYVGVFGHIRDLYANTESSQEKGYAPGQFSFNVPQGRCFACDGDGVKRIEMQFLSDVFVKCDECNGKRYNTETLSVMYKGKNISDVLEMTVDEALSFFENIPNIKKRLQTIHDVGLGYIKLGQSSTTLSGGEAQRVKLATELAKRETGSTLYILDEPTTGLHFADVQKLLDVLNRLTNIGNTILVIEHNMDVIKNADWIIDLGPEGGDEGGHLVASGTPKQIAATQESFTGQYLKNIL